MSKAGPLQFKSKIAFKLIWLPSDFDEFVLVDDDGTILKRGRNLNKEFPPKRERMMNWRVANGEDGMTSKYTRNLRY